MTGVQTCALPIFEQPNGRGLAGSAGFTDEGLAALHGGAVGPAGPRIYDMVDHREHPRRIQWLAHRGGEAAQRCGSGTFVKQHAVNRQQHTAWQGGGDVALPQAVE